MTVAMEKAKISGISGFIAAIATFFSSYNSLFIFAGLGIFLITLSIQYGSIKIKIATSLVSGVFLLVTFFEGVIFP